MFPPRRVQFWLSTVSLSTLMLPIGYAGIALFTLTPLTPTIVTLSSTDTVEVDYLLTNQSMHPHRLVMTPIAGVMQQMSPGDCSSPVTLSYQQSCRLALIIDGHTLVNNVSMGPVICQDGNPLQCYQPAEEARLAITLAGEPTSLSLKPATLPTATLASAYEQPITISGGTPPYLYAITLGALPPGLILDATTGLISGSATVDGSYTFTLGVTDSQGQHIEQRYTLLVSGFISCNKTITSSLMTTNPYNQTLTIHYLMAGGGGGSGGGPNGNGAGGGGGSSAILVDNTLITFTAGGDGGASTVGSPAAGQSGSKIEDTPAFSIQSNATLSAIVGGGGGSGGGTDRNGGGAGGGGGSGYYGGGGGASNGNGFFGGGGGSNISGAAGGDGRAGMSEQGGSGGGGGIIGRGNGGSGASDNDGGLGGAGNRSVGGGGGGGGGGFGSGGGGGGGAPDAAGGTGGSNGSNGNDGNAGIGQGLGGLGASTFPSSISLPQEAGMGGQQVGQAGNGGLIIIQYNSPTTTCLL